MGLRKETLTWMGPAVRRNDERDGVKSAAIWLAIAKAELPCPTKRYMTPSTVTATNQEVL